MLLYEHVLFIVKTVRLCVLFSIRGLKKKESISNDVTQLGRACTLRLVVLSKRNQYSIDLPGLPCF